MITLYYLILSLCQCIVSIAMYWKRNHKSDQELEEILKENYSTKIQGNRDKKEQMVKFFAAMKDPSANPEQEKKMQEVLYGGKGDIKRHYAVDEKLYGTQEGVETRRKIAEEEQQMKQKVVKTSGSSSGGGGSGGTSGKTKPKKKQIQETNIEKQEEDSKGDHVSSIRTEGESTSSSSSSNAAASTTSTTTAAAAAAVGTVGVYALATWLLTSTKRSS
jgi:hypothetical protein